jgi:hypothetical protein
MNQVEIIVQHLGSQALRIADLTSKNHLRAKLELFICKWNQHAHPFNWSTKSVVKVMVEVPALEA